MTLQIFSRLYWFYSKAVDDGMGFVFFGGGFVFLSDINITDFSFSIMTFCRLQSWTLT